MRAGDLNREIVIQQITRTQNASGEQEESTSTFATVWAAVTYIRGAEPEAAQMQAGQQLARFRIYPLSGLKMEMKISYDGLIWDIQEIRPFGFEEGIDLIAMAVRN